MITRDRFNNLKKGDLIIFKSGRVREITRVSQSWRKKLRIVPFTYLEFKKVGGIGTTLCCFANYGNKMIGRVKIIKRK